MGYVGLCLAYGLNHVFRSPRRGAAGLLTGTPMVFLLAYIALCGLSTLWSPRPVYTCYRSFECLAYLVLIAIICDNLNSNCSAQNVIEWLVVWSVWFLFWDTIRYTRIVGVPAMLSIDAFRRGAFALGMLFFLTLFISKRRLFILLNVVYTFLSLANKTYFGIAFGLVPGMCVGDRRFHTTLFFILGFATLGYLLMGSSMIQNTLFYGKGGIGLEYTTGRLWLLTRTLEFGMQRFYCGYGFAAGEVEIMRAEMQAIISAHSVFSSAFLGVGFLGPVVFVLFFATLAIMSLRADLPASWRPAFLGTTIMILIISSTSPGLGARVYGSWVPAVLASAGMCALANSERLLRLNGIDVGEDELPASAVDEEFGLVRSSYENTDYADF
jgi:hypothetical protein